MDQSSASIPKSNMVDTFAHDFPRCLDVVLML
jgi:hypothetical protein